MNVQAAQPASVTLAYRAVRRSGVWRGLFWHEWFTHGSLLLMVLSIWLIGQWVLLVFFHPQWILIAGTALAIAIGAKFAGGDAIDGAEEFSLALPPLRHHRYLVRLAISLGCMFALLTSSLLAIRFEWPQALWGLLVGSGFTDPFPSFQAPGKPIEWYWYWYAFSMPMAVYGVTFALAALASGRDQIGVASVLGVVFAGLGLGFGYVAGYWLFGPFPETAKGPSFLQPDYAMGAVVDMALCIGFLVAGYFAHRRKEGIARPRGSGNPDWRLAFSATGIVLVVLVVLMFVLMATT